MPELTLDFAVQDYLLALQVAGRAPGTLREKEHRLRLFCQWMATQDARTVEDVTSARYRDFMAYLQAAHYGDHHDHIASRANRPRSIFSAIARFLGEWYLSQSRDAAKDLR